MSSAAAAAALCTLSSSSPSLSRRVPVVAFGATAPERALEALLLRDRLAAIGVTVVAGIVAGAGVAGTDAGSRRLFNSDLDIDRPRGAVAAALVAVPPPAPPPPSPPSSAPPAAATE